MYKYCKHTLKISPLFRQKGFQYWLSFVRKVSSTNSLSSERFLNCIVILQGNFFFSNLVLPFAILHTYTYKISVTRVNLKNKYCNAIMFRAIVSRSDDVFTTYVRCKYTLKISPLFRQKGFQYWLSFVRKVSSTNSLSSERFLNCIVILQGNFFFSNLVLPFAILHTYTYKISVTRVNLKNKYCNAIMFRAIVSRSDDVFTTYVRCKYTLKISPLFRQKGFQYWLTFIGKVSSTNSLSSERFLAKSR